MRILLVDDEPFMLKLLANQLAKLDCDDVVPFEHAQDALVELERDAAAVSLVFCDLQMPQMDGVELLRHLARLGYEGGLVLVSGEDRRILRTVQNLAKAHGLNVVGCLHKPVSLEQLQQVLAGKISRSATAVRAIRKSYDAEELRRAIAGGELVNHYQPKVEIATGSVAGVETLVRWRHPRDGMVYPDQFISTAEQHGLIHDLTRAVLTDALRQARVWHDMGLDLHVAVNVSMDNLGALDFPDFVARAVAKAGIPLASLVLEVTESRLMQDPLAPLDILTRLRLKHIGLSIDDFGTGHSSLAQLRDIPFDELKVDRGFIHGAGRDPSMRAIVEASLAMAQQLGMRTVAEGVEDEADWNFVRSAGCDIAQGYYIAKPMPAEALAGWIAAWNGGRRTLAASAA